MNNSDEVLSQEVFHRLLAFLHQVRQHSHQIQSQGLKPREFSVLQFLVESGPLTVGKIQEFLHRSASTTSALVAQLEESGYLTRTRSKDDNRVVIVELTEIGRDIVKKTPLVGLPLLRRKLKTLPKERLVLLDDALNEIMQLMEDRI